MRIIKKSGCDNESSLKFTENLYFIIDMCLFHQLLPPPPEKPPPENPDEPENE